jgi:uncharacterized protein YjbI with pentapeptide repeats
MATQRKQEGPAAPRLTAPRPRGLGSVPDADVVEGDDDLDAVEVSGLRADALSWTGRRRLGGSRVTGLSVGTWSAPAASFVDSVLDAVEVVSLDAAGSSWWNVEVTGSRVGSGALYDSTWRSVHASRCKLGYLNLRDAQLTDVVFSDCTIEELDLARATASRLAFPGSRIARIELTGSRLADVDLRDARVDDVGNLEGLRGASITTAQLLDLAPALAARLGIRVE